MSTRTGRTAWLLGWILAGCGFSSAAGQGTVVNAEDVRTKGLLIGLKQQADAPCPQPTVAGWKVEPLFLDEDNQAPTAQENQVLASFCLYERQQGGEETLPQPQEIVRLEPDYLAMTTEGAMGIDPFWQKLEEKFLEQIGKKDTSGQILPLTAAGAQVRLTFLDTQPTANSVQTGSGTSSHGYTLSHIAQRLVCNNTGQCAAQVGTHLALSVLSFRPTITRDTKNGGYMGTVGDLARAVFRAIRRWQKLEGQDGGFLVLNLSVGWDGEQFGGLGKVEEMPLAMQSVYHILKFAAQNPHVLVIAAAGNGGFYRPPPHAALLPAGWESRNEVSEPLVYAAGGVRSDGSSLLPERSGGIPRRVAFSEQAVVQNKVGAPTPVYTGTSVSAAVISAIAATVWHFRPDLTRADLMKLIDSSGDDLGRPASVYSGSSRPNVHRIALCPVIAEACKGGRCTAPSCPPWVRDPVDLRSILTGLDLPVINARLLTNEIQTSRPPCFSVRWVRYASPTPADLCPSDHLPSPTSRPWIGTQPPEDPCPTCSLKLASATSTQYVYDLTIHIKDNLKYCMSSLDLDLGDHIGRHWDFPTTLLCPGKDLVIKNISTRSRVTSATKTFKDVSSADIAFTDFVRNIYH